MEISYKQIGAVILAIIALGSGSLLYLEKTGNYHNCRSIWNENPDGTYTCPKDNYTDYCYEIENRGNGWYRCWIGNPVIIKEESNQKVNKGRWICNPNECIEIK